MEQKPQIIRADALLPGRLLLRAFFEDAPDRVAPRLLGKLLVHRTRKGILAGRIVEAEAYLGPHHDPPDPAAHSYRGPTPRNQVLFGPAGHAYVYVIYGRSFCMNVSCEPNGLAGCVLIRALEPVHGWRQMERNRSLEPGAPRKALTSGPGRLTQALGLTRTHHNGLDLTDADSALQLRDDGVEVGPPLITPRIGIRHAIDWPLRFAIDDHPFISGPRKFSSAVSSF